MLYYVTLDTTQTDHPLVNAIKRTIEGESVPGARLVQAGEVWYKGLHWKESLDGYRAQFSHMVVEVPAVLDSPAVCKVELEFKAEDLVGITPGLYDDTPGISCQITTYRHEGSPVYPVRIESVKLRGADAFSTVNEYYSRFMADPSSFIPTTPWVPTAPI
ncbi:MAG TPA: hypothetical protein VGH44_00095 [Candidatus Saccharimonadia bacterium]|jgi:hypothetical protein